MRLRWLTVVLSVGVAKAALLYEEGYPAGSNGWTYNGAAAVAHSTGGYLEATFAFQEVPAPGSVMLVASNGASGGAFTGSYVNAGIELLGFSFRARDTKPSLLQVRLYGADQSFFRNVEVAPLVFDRWHRIVIPLQTDAAAWQGGSYEVFTQLLDQVRGVAVQVTRNGSAGQRYDMDRIGLYRLPRASAMSWPSSPGPVVTWSGLQPGVTHVVERAESAAGPWAVVDQLPASTTNQVWTNTAVGPGSAVLYRILCPSGP